MALITAIDPARDDSIDAAWCAAFAGAHMHTLLIPPGAVMSLGQSIVPPGFTTMSHSDIAVQVLRMFESHAETVPMRNVETGEVEDHNRVNAADLIRSKLWVCMICDACNGKQEVNGEECWHCGGGGIDPTK